MTADETRNDRNRRAGQTFSFYVHFDEKDALDRAAKKAGLSRNALLRQILRQNLGLPPA